MHWGTTGKLTRTLALVTVCALAAGACGNDDDKGASSTAPSASSTSAAAPASSTATSAGSSTGSSTDSSTATSAGTGSTAASADSTPKGPTHTPPELSDKPGCTATVAGSKLNVGVYASPGKLDPTLIAGGVVGGTEAAALFDTLFMYDDVGKKVIPHLAESIESNADFTEYTLKLRPNIKYSDGTPLDAQMVADNWQRFATEGNTAPQGALVKKWIGSTEAVDATTLKIKMTAPWSEFPAFLSEQLGMIVNTKVAGTDRNAFAAAPPDAAGVGPYILEKNAPGEEILYKARKDYWGGPVCVETLRIVAIPGAQATYDAFQAGELDVAFTRDSSVVADAEKEGIKGYFKFNDLGTMVYLNQREGFVAHDPRLREAIWLAIDPDKINQQVYGGHLQISSSLISTHSVWGSADLDQVKYDPERAKKLVAEAKADGVDVKIDLLSEPSQPQADFNIAVQGFLQAAGFEVTMSQMPINEKIPQVFQGKFELTNWALSIEPAEAATRLYGAWHTGEVNNRGAYSSPDLDKALEDAMKAPADKRKAALAEVNNVFVKEFVNPNFAGNRDGIMWHDNVHDVITNPTNIYLFQRAYID